MTGMANLTMTLACVSSVRHVNLTQLSMRMSYMYYNDIEFTLECDTHADTCCIRRHDLILNDYDRPVIAYEYDPILGSQTFCTVSDVMAYTYPMTGSN